MPDPNITIYADHAQRRIKTTPCTLAALAFEMAGPLSTDILLEPITQCLTIRPYALDPAWYTSNAGNYVKPTKALGYEVKTSARWFEPEVFEGAGTFLQCDDPSGGEYARTSVAPGLNRGVYLIYYAYSAGDRVPVHECGWSNSTTPSAETAAIGFRVWSDGFVQMYRDGDLVADGKVSGGRASAGTQNQVVALVILPCRRRELVIFGTGGDGFRYVFEDIDEDETSPVITPDATKFFVVPGAADSNLQVQFGSLTFPTSASAVSGLYQFGMPPKASQSLFTGWVNPVFTGITTASVFGDTAFAGTTDVDAATLRNEGNTGAFTADGSTTAARTKIDLSGDGSYTPFIYGAVWEYEFEAVETNDGEMADLTDYVETATLNVPDDPFGSSVTLTLHGGMEDGSDVVVPIGDVVPNIATQSYRPVSFEFDDPAVQFFDAYIWRPRLEDSIRERTQKVILECYSVYRLLATYVFESRVPFDGWPLCKPSGHASAVAYVLLRCGADPERLRLSELDHIIGETPSIDGRDWNVTAEPGETGQQVLEKLHRLAADCVYGDHPGVTGPEFWFLAPEDLPVDPVATLCADEATVAALLPGLSGEDIVNALFHSYYSEPLALEANIVRATGLDPRTLSIIQSFAMDDQSLDPELAPSMRPDNWAGVPLTLGATARQLRRQADTDRAVEKLLPIATEVGEVCEWQTNTMLVYEEGGVLLPVWRMDLVNLEGRGEKRVSSVSAQWLKDIRSGLRGEGVTRTARYTGGRPRGHGGTTLDDIQRIQQMRMTQRGFIDVFNSGIAATPAKSVQVVT